MMASKSTLSNSTPNGPVSQPIPRLEGPAKVKGLIRYAADVDRPGTLWGKALRSPLPHARILHVDTSRAKILPGVKAAITGQDVSPRLFGASLKDMPVLARDRVRYVGDDVAAVAAVDSDTAEDAVALIQIDYSLEPCSAKAVGEAGISIVAPAIANGIHDLREFGSRHFLSLPRKSLGD